MDEAGVDRWLRAYVEAWKSYDRDQIGELFAEDVQYRYHPHDDPVVGVVHAAATVNAGQAGSDCRVRPAWAMKSQRAPAAARSRSWASRTAISMIMSSWPPT